VEVARHIDGLKSGASAGYDDISVELIKRVKRYICKPITHIINNSLRTGVFPNIYKQTIIAPIHKSGDPREVSNYRPISLVSNISKIYEKIIKKQLDEFIEQHGLIHKNQFGFRRGMATEDAIAKVTSAIMSHIDEGAKCVGVFIDLRKAFDSVSHEKLISRLKSIGMRGRVLSWFDSYLENRPQMVRVNKKLSDAETTKYGIPQGTVIGPVLFTLYVDAMLGLTLNGSLFSYADDTVLIVGASSWGDLNINVNRDIKYIKEWIDTNCLSMNIDKTNYLMFSLMPNVEETSNFKISINDSEIKRVNYVKYLGIFVNDDMKWGKQIETTIKRLRKTIYVLLRLRNILDLKTLRMVYFALIQSILQYGILGWGGTYRSNLENLYVTQRLILKILLKKPRDFSTKELFQLSNVMTIEELFERVALMHIYRNIGGTEQLTRVEPRIGRCLRLPRHRTTAAQKCFTYRGIKSFNGLPRELRDELSISIFKKKLKQMYNKKVKMG
jgi:hypothetical protein